MTSAGEQLLAIQDRDLAIDRLRHRRETFPARAELAEIGRRGVDLEAVLAEARGRLASVAGRQQELERELAASEARQAEVDRRLYSGEVTASRELMSMSAESDQLKDRRSHLEDELLEILEAREPHDAEVEGLMQQREELIGEAQRLSEQVAAEEKTIDDELASELEARQVLQAAFPDAALLTTYERLRQRLGGIGAARLAGNACDGCHLVLAAQELDRLRRMPADELVTCEQCGRILVR